MNSQKTQGFLLLLIFVWLGTFFLNENFASEFNSRNLIRYCMMFGIIGIGVMFVIVTGGIDLSIGSTIGLVGASLVALLRLNPIETLKPLSADEQTNIVWFFWILVWIKIISGSVWLVLACLKKNKTKKKIAFPLIFLSLAILSFVGFQYANSDAPNTARIPWIVFLLLSTSLHIGLMHGVLITKFELQPFVVTLCGLLCYRGLTRWLTTDLTQGLGTTFIDSFSLVAKGEICTFSTLMCISGFCLALYSGFLLVFKKCRDDKAKRGAVVAVAIGLIIGLIGSSRFWNGFSRENITVLFDTQFLGFIPLKFSMWTTVVTEEAAARPQVLMGYCLIPMILILLASVVLLVVNLVNKKISGEEIGQLSWLPLYVFWLPESKKKNGLVYLAASILGTVLAGFALRYSYLLASEQIEVDWTDAQLWWVKMITVFGSLALVMVSISRVAHCNTLHGNGISKTLFPIGGTLAILVILARTEISTTTVQTPFFITCIVAIFTIIIFDKTVFGRYLLAIGNNENAAKFSGIDTQEVKVAAYVICSGIVGLAAMIFMLDSNSVSPSQFGTFYELYAIAAVVLGGCSLRGGEANVIGVLLGASIMRILANAPDMIDFPKELEYTILGLVILIGVIVDDRIRRNSARKALEANRVE